VGYKTKYAKIKTCRHKNGIKIDVNLAAGVIVHLTSSIYHYSSNQAANKQAREQATNQCQMARWPRNATFMESEISLLWSQDLPLDHIRSQINPVNTLISCCGK
jgi:hypothetical protein